MWKRFLISGAVLVILSLPIAIGSSMLVMVLGFSTVGASPPAEKQEVLSRMISRGMGTLAVGLVPLAAGLVLIVVGAVANARAPRPKRAPPQ